MVAYPHHRIPFRREIDRDGEKTPFEPKELLHLLVARPRRVAAGMHVGGGAAAEFPGATHRIDRRILPVAVAGDNDHAGLGSDEPS